MATAPSLTTAPSYQGAPRGGASQRIRISEMHSLPWGSISHLGSLGLMYKIADAGAIPPLVGLTKRGAAAVKVQAEGALKALAAGSDASKICYLTKGVA